MEIRGRCATLLTNNATMAALPDFWNSAGKDVLIGVGWLLTIVGWLVSSRQANKREERKEIRSEVDACCRTTAELLAKTRKYYAMASAPDSEAVTGAEIRFDLQRLFVRVERLERIYPQFDVMNAGGELLDSITGGDFEVVTRVACAADSEKMLKIESDAHFLMDSLEDGFQRAFR